MVDNNTIADLVDAHTAGITAFAEWLSGHWSMSKADQAASEGTPISDDYRDGWNAALLSVPDALKSYREEYWP